MISMFDFFFPFKLDEKGIFDRQNVRQKKKNVFLEYTHIDHTDSKAGNPTPSNKESAIRCDFSRCFLHDEIALVYLRNVNNFCCNL